MPFCYIKITTVHTVMLGKNFKTQGETNCRCRRATAAVGMTQQNTQISRKIIVHDKKKCNFFSYNICCRCSQLMMDIPVSHALAENALFEIALCEGSCMYLRFCQVILINYLTK